MIAIGLAMFAISAVSTDLAMSAGVAVQQGELSLDPPYRPLSFLRVVDPSDSIVTSYRTEADMSADSVLDTPGLSVLMKRMVRDERMFMTLELGALTSRRLYFTSSETPVGDVFIGRSPVPLRGAGAEGAGPQWWGQVPAGTDGLTPRAVGPLRLHVVSTVVPERSYIDGRGLRLHTGGRSLMLLTPSDAVSIGVARSFIGLPDVTSGFTCYCDVSVTKGIAAEMTAAERKAGSKRYFFALPYEGLIGPVERSDAAAMVLSAAFGIGTGLSLCAFAYMSVLLFWRRRAHDYAVEQRSGAAEAALQMRQQVIIAAAVTVPLAAGFVVVDFFSRGSTPVPWPPYGGVPAVAVMLLLQTALGAPTMVRIHRLYTTLRG